MFNSEKMIKNIKDLCIEKDIKISDLEREVGLSKGNLSRWAKSCPTPITSLVKISEILHVSTDYILNNNFIHETANNKERVLNKLLQDTEAEVVVWEKIMYAKSKKIPVISSTNEIIYNSNIVAYDTVFSDTNIIFVHYNSDNSNTIYIERNNEYFCICKNDSTAILLHTILNNKKQNIVNDFFNNIDIEG